MIIGLIGCGGALAVLLLVVGVFVVAIYNRLVTLRNRVDNAWSQIDVQLKRRYDLIPNLMETVKGYASHERETFEKVTQARNMAVDAKTVDGRSRNKLERKCINSEVTYPRSTHRSIARRHTAGVLAIQRNTLGAANNVRQAQCLQLNAFNKSWVAVSDSLVAAARHVCDGTSGEVPVSHQPVFGSQKLAVQVVPGKLVQGGRGFFCYVLNFPFLLSRSDVFIP